MNFVTIDDIKDPSVRKLAEALSEERKRSQKLLQEKLEMRIMGKKLLDEAEKSDNYFFSDAIIKEGRKLFGKDKDEADTD